ncbi:hypothetical protein TTHERM_01341610 (macronuclear) [Tetrahymena thermophila SB210]|uniref:Uncharacterized protein n=1 Tax=Tetrahymena thermophila (strain SB210) TaxID=312017 RepID=Q24HQ4_TETTS|nr:hypothetical protein TTHERM_01341610 [Tetrahymena thermophila SB210]EAS07309.1 hypothetical protein TTHERM_01341610 [Tetrahymena thermophila SB210]|eukprot:XP_001027551.1 hypothetical protein TTHERM_01341610 [Tetrahymena thermophila SB210]
MQDQINQEIEENRALRNNYKKNITRMFMKFLSTVDEETYDLIKQEFKKKVPDLKFIIKKYDLRKKFESFFMHFPRLYFSSEIQNKQDKLSTYFDCVTYMYEDMFLPKKK